MRYQVSKILETSDTPLRTDAGIFMVRDLLGRVRISVSDVLEDDVEPRKALRHLAESLNSVLGAHGYAANEAVLFVDSAMLQDLRDGALEVHPGVYWVDRLVTGRDWWTIGRSRPERSAKRYTLYSVKGGVGRSTTSVVLAWQLGQRGERVLVVDLDLESPGLSSAILDEQMLPRFGVTDWFVEDLVSQGDHVIDEMTATPPWALDFDGEVHVVPAHGRDPGEYLAKMGRVYMDTELRWTARLEHLLSQLEERYEPTIVLLESRSGLHDIAAVTVTNLDAHVFLFAVDSESHWADYDTLFRHWQTLGVASAIRERLSVVSALTPFRDTEQYLQRFRERAWNLFRDRLYDEVDPSARSGSEYSFDVDDEDAPHDPFTIHWTSGFAPGGASLRTLEQTTVTQAYVQFIIRFHEFVKGQVVR